MKNHLSYVILSILNRKSDKTCLTSRFSAKNHFRGETQHVAHLLIIKAVSCCFSLRDLNPIFFHFPVTNMNLETEEIDDNLAANRVSPLLLKHLIFPYSPALHRCTAFPNPRMHSLRHHPQNTHSGNFTRLSNGAHLLAESRSSSRRSL